MYLCLLDLRLLSDYIAHNELSRTSGSCRFQTLMLLEQHRDPVHIQARDWSSDMAPDSLHEMMHAITHMQYFECATAPERVESSLTEVQKAD